MNFRTTILALMLGLCACAPALVVAQNTDFPAQRCVNLANALNAPNEGEWGYVIRKTDLQRISLAGFDSVRVLIAWHQHAGAEYPYTIDPAFFTRIDQVVDQAREYGLAVILDLHDYEELYIDPGAHGARTLAIWDQIARHYAKAPLSVIFELMNEPQDKLQGQAWQNLADRLLTIVRHSNPDRWIIMGGDNWNSIDGLARYKTTYDPRLLLTFHYYDPYQFTHQGATWFKGAPPAGRPWGNKAEKRYLQREFTRAAAIGKARGMPLFLGEFGATKATNMQDRARWTREVKRAAEENNISWCYFDFAAEFGVYSPKRENWVWPLRRALFDQEALALRPAAE